MNGEIYNFRELREELIAKGHRFRTGSDAEVLAHLYEEHGERLVEHLVGMYAFALVDRRGEVPTLLLARDRLGIKPLYWSWDGEVLAWASEPKAILALERGGAVARRLRGEALLDYLVQGYVAASTLPGRGSTGCRRPASWSGARARSRASAAPGTSADRLAARGLERGPSSTRRCSSGSTVACPTASSPTCRSARSCRAGSTAPPS